MEEKKTFDTPGYDLLSWRREFPAVEQNTYLFNHSLGAMPKSVYAQLKEYSDIWNYQPVKAWEASWWGLLKEFGNILADILNAPYDSIAVQPNVTSAAALILSAMEFTHSKNKVVYSSLDFPSLKYLINSWVPAEVERSIVHSDDGITIDENRMIEAIDDNTLVVFVTHASFRSSFLQKPDNIIKRARECGAYVVLDVYQSAGVVPIDIRAMDPDFVIGGSIKWLCGGPGTGYLYVRPGLAMSLEPKLTGWLAHENPFEFADDMRFTDQIPYRFLNGTPNIPALFAAKAGVEIIRKVGVPAIRTWSQRLTEKIVEQVSSKGLVLNSPRDPEQRGGTVVVQVENGDRITAQLNEMKFLVDWRPQAGIRISPHFYTTEDECVAVIDEISALVNKQK